jgi:hypothetical protein
MVAETGSGFGVAAGLDRRRPALDGKRQARGRQGIALGKGGDLQPQSLMASGAPDVAVGWRASMKRVRAERAVAEA